MFEHDVPHEATPELRVTVLSVTVRLSGPLALVARLRSLWARCASPKVDSGPSILEYSVVTEPSVDSSEAAQIVLSDSENCYYHAAGRVTWDAIALQDPTTILLHGAALDWQGSGRVLSLVATSGTGKTTACLQLARHRHGYVTDEVVSIDCDRRVTAYPKPLSVVQDSGRPYDKELISPDDLQLLNCSEDLAAGPIVILNRILPDEHARLELVPVSPAMAVTELVSNCLSFPTMAAPLAGLTTLATSVGVYRLTYSEIADAERLLDELMAADDGEPAVPWRPSSRTSNTVERPVTAGRLFQAPVSDAVEIFDEVVLLCGDVPILLTPLGATIWSACRHGATAEMLTTMAVQEHGEHPDAAGMVAETIALMQSQGILTSF